MKAHRETIHVQTQDREEIINITSAVERACTKSGIREGLALVFPHHTSAAVYISDSDGNLTEDLRRVLAELVPEGRPYAHDKSDAKRNAHAHLRATLAGHHCVVPVTDGKLDLGRFQTIYYAEFDGKRRKEIVVKIIGE